MAGRRYTRSYDRAPALLRYAARGSAWASCGWPDGRVLHSRASASPGESSREPAPRRSRRASQAFFAGEPDDFADVELDLDDGFYGDCAARAARRAARRGRHLRRARRARRPSGRRPRRRHVLRPEPPRRRSSRCHRVVSAGGIGSFGSLGVEYKRRMLALEACRSLTSCATSSPRSRPSGAAAASPSSRRSATPPGRGTCTATASSGSTSTCRARRRHAAPSRSSATSASARRSAPISAGRSTARPATSSTSRSTTGGRDALARPGVLSASGAPLELPPKRVVGRSCCRGAYLRGALLGAGSLSGPRAPHLELRATDREGAGLLAEIAATRGGRAQGRRAAGPRGGIREGRRDDRRSPRARRRERDARSVSTSTPSSPRTRAEANRLANADEANVKRTVDAAQRQLEAIGQLDLEALPRGLQEIAALRLKHPELSLAELAARCRPPITKAAAHHRMSDAILQACGGGGAPRTNSPSVIPRSELGAERGLNPASTKRGLRGGSISHLPPPIPGHLQAIIAPAREPRHPSVASVRYGARS